MNSGAASPNAQRIRGARLGAAGLRAGFASVCAWALSVACAVPPPASPFPSARVAIDRMRELHACSRALRGEARLDYFDADGRFRVKTLFITEHPMNVRFDLFSPFGQTLITLTANGKDFALLDQEQKQYFVGNAAQCNVERFLKVPIPPAALVQLLAGEAPILLHEPSAARIEWDDGHYVLYITGKHRASQRVVLELVEADLNKPYSEQRVRVVEVAVSQAGVELYRAELEDHAPAPTAKPRLDPEGIEAPVNPSGPPCRAELPRRIRFVVPLAERDVLFEQTDLAHN
ncbi:MAG: hypothetical protein RJA70_2169, partial [Pseudomonadota bacterium]